MKYSPRKVIFCAVERYLSDHAYTAVLEDIGKEFPKQDRKFLAILSRYLDFDLLKDKPVIWQDIWIYNYLKYEYTGSKLVRNGLLAKYERDIILPTEKSFKALMEVIG